MAVTRWLAIYVDDHGTFQSAMITPRTGGDMPFGVNASALGVPGMTSGVVFVEMPADPDFRPMIVDSDNDGEVAIRFVDL